MNFSDLRPGLSVGDRSILAYKTNHQGNRYLYLIAGVHGDEVEGVYVLQELYKWILEIDELPFPIIVIPILNIDGYNSRTRVNANGVDLNRNLPTPDWSADFKKKIYNPGSEPLSEPENNYLNELFEKFPPALIMSFHSWKPIVNYNGNCREDANLIGNLNHYPVLGDIGYPTPGSLGTFAPYKYKSPVITFECPKLNKNLALTDIWEENKLGLKTYIESSILKSHFINKN